MRSAVPSSKVGSCDSASAAAERDSGVDAGAALGAATRVGFAAIPGLGGAAAIGFAGAGAVPGLRGIALWPSAGALASIAATAAIVIVRIGISLPKRVGVLSCLLSKSLVELLQWRSKQDWMVTGFDMSLQRLRWFATRTRTKPFGRLHALDAPTGDCRMWWTGCADRAAGVCANNLSQPHYQDDRALSGRRHDRFPRPSGSRADQDRAWRHRHCREQARRRDHARRGAGRKGGGRRLHAVDGDLDHACHQQDAVQEIAVRP